MSRTRRTTGSSFRDRFTARTVPSSVITSTLNTSFPVTGSVRSKGVALALSQRAKGAPAAPRHVTIRAAKEVIPAPGAEDGSEKEELPSGEGSVTLGGAVAVLQRPDVSPGEVMLDHYQPLGLIG
jgi:hypothetical protein